MLLVMVDWYPFEVPVPLASQVAPLTGLGEVCSIHLSLQRTMVLLVLWEWALLLCFILRRTSQRAWHARKWFYLISSPPLYNFIGAFPKLGCDYLHTCLFCSTDSECLHQRLYLFFSFLIEWHNARHIGHPYEMFTEQEDILISMKKLPMEARKQKKVNESYFEPT